MSSSNSTLIIWNFRDDMLESGCEMDADYLKTWLLCLLNKETYVSSTLSWIFGLKNSTNDLVCNSLLMSLLYKIKLTPENNRVMEYFAINIK